MKEYRYSDPASGVTLPDGIETLLWPGKTVPLSKEHDYMKVLVALKHLTPELEDAKPAATSAAQSPKRRSSSDSKVKAEDAHSN